MNYTGSSIDFGNLGMQAMKAASAERATATAAASKATAQGLSTVGKTAGESMIAQAKVKGAEIGAEATKMQGIMDGIGALAGAFGSMGGQNSAEYTNKVDFGGGKFMMANDNGRLLHNNFDFSLPK